jgi:hypothetical protein
MVRRHLRLFGLLGLLTLLALGCRAPVRRQPGPAPLPLVNEGQGQRTTLPEAPAPLAIRDTEATAPVIVQEKPQQQLPPAQQQPPAQPPPQTAQPTPPQPRPAQDVKPAVVSTPPTSVPVSTGSPTPPAGNSPLRTLHRVCAERYATIDSYIVSLRRREVNNGSKQPEEELMLKFRKEPWSVYFKWLGKAYNGREVVFVKGRYSNQMHILMGANEGFLRPKGKRVDISPDDPMVKSNSRHSITEAGIGNMIERFGNLLDTDDTTSDPRAKLLRYIGPCKRPEYGDTPLEAVHQYIQPGREAQLPRGGQRWWFFDTTLRLPVMIITVDDRNQEVEYYSYDRFLFPGRLTDDEFNPDNLGRLRN